MKIIFDYKYKKIPIQPVDVGHKFGYVISGYDTTYLSTTRFYNLSTWTNKANNIAISNIKGTYWENKIYIYGGYDGAHRDYNREYDYQNDSWATRQHLISPRGQNESCDNLNIDQDNNRIDEYSSQSDAWTNIYNNTLNDKWQISGWLKNQTDYYWGQSPFHHFNKTTLTVNTVSANLARNVPGATTLNDIIYAMNGQNGSTYTSDVGSYDHSNDTWTTLTSCIINGYAHSGFNDTQHVFLAGGQNGSGRLNDLVKYDTSSTAWSTEQDMNGDVKYGASGQN